MNLMNIDVEKIEEKMLEYFDGFGLIHERKRVLYKNKKGDLVWDYIVYNEISFVPDEDPKSIERLFSSFSDKKTREKYNNLYKKYKISE